MWVSKSARKTATINEHLYSTGVIFMNTTSNGTTLNRRLIFGVVAIFASFLVSILIYSGVANPYPDMKTAFMLCLGVAAFGVIQLMMAWLGTERK